MSEPRSRPAPADGEKRTSPAPKKVRKPRPKPVEERPEPVAAAHPDDLDWWALPGLSDLRRELTENSKGLLVSAGIHLVLGLLLAFVVIQNVGGTGGGDGYDEALGWLTADQGSGPDFRKRESIKVDSIVTPSLPGPGPAAPTAPQTPSEAPASSGSSGNGVPGGGSPVGVAGALGGRGGDGRARLLKLFGGTKKSEGAVSSGLLWLSRMQTPDGRWEMHQGYDDPGFRPRRTDSGATALALLCFVGAGHTHDKPGKYQETMQKGVKWLIGQQKPEGHQFAGDLHDFEEEGRETWLTVHSQGTIVLCELYALTKDETLREPAERALRFLLTAQASDGGWKLRPGAGKGNLTVTGWGMMALQSARMGGFDVPEDQLRHVYLFLDSVELDDGARYKYEPNDPDSHTSLTVTAEGLLCRQYLGWPKDHPALQKGVKYLLEPDHLPQWSADRRNAYAWYYATQVMRNMGGEAWETWNPAVRDAISNSQVRGGKMAGSWSPVQPPPDPTDESRLDGRLYLTCLCLLTLEVYYRYLPVYPEDAPPGDAETENTAAP